MDLRAYLPDQEPNESIYIFVRPYFLSFLPTFGLGVGLVLAGILMIVITAINFPGIAAGTFEHNLFVIIASAYFLTLIPFFTVAFLTYYYDIQIVTDHRIVDIDQISLFKREVNELDLEEVQDASSTTAGILSSFFDFGNVLIETAGSQPKFFFNNVLHPQEIATIIVDLAGQAKQDPGKNAHQLVPNGRAKAVINDKVYTSTAELTQMGVMVPETQALAPEETPPPPKTNVPEAPLVSPPPAKPTQPSSDSDLDITIDEPTNNPKK